MNNWMDYAKAAADMADTLTKQYGPEAWETILWITTLNNLSILLNAVITLVLLVGGSYISYRIAKYFAEMSESRSYTGLAFLFAPWLLSSHIYFELFSLWVWVGVFKPDLYLAKTLIDKVIN